MSAVTFEVTVDVADVGDVLHLYTKLEVLRPSRSEDIADFSVTVLSGLTTLTFVLFTLELVRNVTRCTDNLPANFAASVTFRCRVTGKRVDLTT